MGLASLSIEETILIAAPPETVWRLLTDLHTWRHWWPGCLEAEAGDRKKLHDGSEFKLVLRLGFLNLKFRPRVAAASVDKSLVWSGRSAGVVGRHAFYLEAKPNGTFVRQQESFHGGGVLFYRLLRLDRATQRMFRANLKGLKRMAERGG